MKSIYYSAAWTDSGFFLACSHEHKTIVQADSCISCAGGYVVAVENGVVRSLTPEEEAEWQCVHYVPRTNNPAVPDEEEADDPRYAVMIKIRVGDRWIWTTWMCYATYAQAAAHAQEGNRVVRFRSAEYVALRKQTEAASPLVIKAPEESIRQDEDETVIEFVNRFLTGYGFDQPAEPHSGEKHCSVDPAGLIPIVSHGLSFTSETPNQSSLIETPIDFARLILSRLTESETHKLGRMSNEDILAILKLLTLRFLTVRPKGGCR
jgi:hypothetical protein